MSATGGKGENTRTPPITKMPAQDKVRPKAARTGADTNLTQPKRKGMRERGSAWLP